MKIAILSVFPPFRGGIAQFNAALVEALKAEGHTVLPINFSRQYPELLFPGKSQFIDSPTSKVTPAMLDSVSPKSWRRTAHRINEERPDAVIVPFWTGFLVPALTGVMRRLKDTRVIGLMHNAYPHDAGMFQKAMTRRFISNCDEFISLSRDVHDRLKKEVQKKPVLSAFHPVYEHFPTAIPSLEARAKLEIPEDKYVLLFFGLVRPYKGLDVLLHAFNALPEDFFLVIAGESYEKGEKYRQIPDASHKKRIRWDDGFIPEERVSEYFSAADCVVLPYKNASQSGVTAVAMHYSKPVIASNVGGLQEYIKENVNGRLFPAGEVSALTKAILKQRENPTDNQRYASWKRSFQWDAFGVLLTQWLHQE